MLSILQPEISSLESQVAQLQAQITAHAERIALLNEAEFVTGGSLEALKSAVEKVSSLAPGALANLRTAVLSLFNNDDQLGNDNGNQPANPTPDTPTSGTGPKAEPNSGEELTGQVCEVYFEGYWDTTTPNGSFWELASPFACQLSDCPAESLQGQAVEITCDREDKGQRFCELVSVSPTVAYVRKFDGEVLAVYVGGSNKGKLKNWGDWLTRTHSVTHGYQLREAKRLDAKWEIKLTPMTLTQIEKLATCDFNRDPRSVYPDAPKRSFEGAPNAPRVTQIEDIGVGDRIRSVTVKHWEYNVIGIKEDGCLDCERIGVTPTIRLSLNPASIELVTKAVSEEEALASIQPPLEQQFSYSLLESSNLDQRWSVSHISTEGKQQFLGSVSCGSNTQRWSHSRQPKYGQNIPYYPSKETAAEALAKAYERDSMPRLAAVVGLV